MYTREARSTYSEVNICLHDEVEVAQLYFFAGSKSFFELWNSFIRFVDKNSLGRDTFNFSVISFDEVPNDSKTGFLNESTPYSLDYTLELFDSYDGSPIKVLPFGTVNFCDIYVGDFFMSR